MSNVGKPTKDSVIPTKDSFQPTQRVRLMGTILLPPLFRADLSPPSYFDPLVKQTPGVTLSGALLTGLLGKNLAN
jgi:hypothetical protein